MLGNAQLWKIAAYEQCRYKCLYFFTILTNTSPLQPHCDGDCPRRDGD